MCAPYQGVWLASRHCLPHDRLHVTSLVWKGNRLNNPRTGHRKSSLHRSTTSSICLHGTCRAWRISQTVCLSTNLTLFLFDSKRLWNAVAYERSQMVNALLLLLYVQTFGPFQTNVESFTLCCDRKSKTIWKKSNRAPDWWAKGD